MDLKEYFAQSDTPAPNSPIGELMTRILDKNPGMGFEETRIHANALQQKAAGRWRYSMPRILSPEQQAKETKRLQRAFRKPSTLQFLGVGERQTATGTGGRASG